MKEKYLSISYCSYYKEFSFIDNIELFDCRIVKQLAEVIEENDINADGDPYPCGYFDDADEFLREIMEPVFQKFLNETEIYVHNAGDSVERLDATKYFDELWNYFFGNENSYCKSADLISKSLEKFIEQGIWQCGIMPTDFDEQPHFIVWFGLPDEEPLSYWTIDPCDFHSVEQWLTKMDWENVLSDICPLGSWGDCVLFWAAECGIDLPDRNKLLNLCPIKIHDDITIEEFHRAVDLAYKIFRSERIIGGANG